MYTHMKSLFIQTYTHTCTHANMRTHTYVYTYILTFYTPTGPTGLGHEVKKFLTRGLKPPRTRQARVVREEELRPGLPSAYDRQAARDVPLLMTEILHGLCKIHDAGFMSSTIVPQGLFSGFLVSWFAIQWSVFPSPHVKWS